MKQSIQWIQANTRRRAGQLSSDGQAAVPATAFPRVCLLLVVLGVVVVVGAPGEKYYESMTPGPNIILIVTDQQRADMIAALGAPWMHTPTLDRLVREGAAYTICFVTRSTRAASPARVAASA